MIYWFHCFATDSNNWTADENNSRNDQHRCRSVCLLRLLLRHIHERRCWQKWLNCCGSYFTFFSFVPILYSLSWWIWFCCHKQVSVNFLASKCNWFKYAGVFLMRISVKLRIVKCSCTAKLCNYHHIFSVACEDLSLAAQDSVAWMPSYSNSQCYESLLLPTELLKHLTVTYWPETKVETSTSSVFDRYYIFS